MFKRFFSNTSDKKDNSAPNEKENTRKEFEDRVRNRFGLVGLVEVRKNIDPQKNPEEISKKTREEVLGTDEKKPTERNNSLPSITKEEFDKLALQHIDQKTLQYLHDYDAFDQQRKKEEDSPFECCL